MLYIRILFKKSTIHCFVASWFYFCCVTHGYWASIFLYHIGMFKQADHQAVDAAL